MTQSECSVQSLAFHKYDLGTLRNILSNNLVLRWSSTITYTGISPIVIAYKANIILNILNCLIPVAYVYIFCNLQIPAGDLTLWMLGNFLKIDYIVICFLKPVNSAWFFMGNDRLSGKQVGSQAIRRVTRRLAWIQPVCISINAVPTLKGLNSL